jgi:hypothetical protein
MLCGNKQLECGENISHHLAHNSIFTTIIQEVTPTRISSIEVVSLTFSLPKVEQGWSLESHQSLWKSFKEP